MQLNAIKHAVPMGVTVLPFRHFVMARSLLVWDCRFLGWVAQSLQGQGYRFLSGRAQSLIMRSLRRGGWRRDRHRLRLRGRRWPPRLRGRR